MTMKSMPAMVLIVGLGGFSAVTPTWAQPANDSNVFLNAPGLLIKKPKPGLPDVQAQPQAWPRLDPGAVLCRMEADLDRLAQHRRGEPINGPVECQIIHTATAISIVQRKGPGKTEVKIADFKGTGMSGWTDAWLPDRAPTGSASVAR